MRFTPFSLLTLLTLLSFSPILSAREFYALLAADTITEVKKATRKDLQNMKDELKHAANAIGANFNITELYGKSLTAEALHTWISQKAMTSDDILFFFYTGHGLRTEKSSTIWPFLYFPSRRELVDTNQLLHLVKSRGAGLSIVLADCCNNFIRQAAVQRSIQSKLAPFFVPEKISKSEDRFGYRRLFRKAKGLIVASGSVPGKRSWATPKGSIFTNAFLTSLRNELDEQFPAWEHIMNKTQSLCTIYQKPQYQAQVSYN